MCEIGGWELGAGGGRGGRGILRWIPGHIPVDPVVDPSQWIPLRSFLPPQTESLRMKPAVVASERAKRVSEQG